MIEFLYNLEEIISKKYCFNKVMNVDIVVNKIRDRFGYHLNKTRTYIIEEYIEREWRDIYSLHYSKTNYAISNTTFRVHLCQQNISSLDELTNDNYLGYFTIRPIPSSINFISRARLKIDYEMYKIKKEDLSIILKVDTIINIENKELKIETFPYFVQDGLVNVCAHSDILMLTKYLYKKMNFSYVDTNRIYTLLNQSQRQIPSAGLTIHEISNLLNTIGYNPLLYRFDNFKLNSIFIEEVIEAYIKSGVPILFAFKNHIVVIAGIIYKNKNRDDIELILYDDSTYFINSFFNVDKKYTKNIALKTIKEKITACKDDCRYQYLIVPTLDRWYLKFEDVYKIAQNFIKPVIDKNDVLACEYQIKNGTMLRKKFLKLSQNFISHFYWVLVWRNKIKGNIEGFSFIDTTIHKNDIYTFNKMLFITIQELRG